MPRYRTLKFRMTQGQLNRSKVLRTSIDQRCLGSPHRMRPISCRIETNFLYPVINDARVLSRPEVGRVDRIDPKRTFNQDECRLAAARRPSFWNEEIAVPFAVMVSYRHQRGIRCQTKCRLC